MKEEIYEIVKIMKQAYEKDISGYDEAFLLKALEKRFYLMGVETTSDYSNYLRGNRTEADALFNSLNITYSEFFRNPLSFALLEQWILPALINQKAGGGEIRIWSAGCSSGQEAYSIAMLLDKLNAGGNGPRIRIFATDISQSVLDLAREGVYNPDALQNVRLKHLNNYFTKNNERYTVTSRLKEYIDFSIYDLLDEQTENPSQSIYGDFDLVFCSNLLFYYKLDVQQFILEKVYKSLAAKGYLITGEAERDLVARMEGLKIVAPPAAIFQKIKTRGVL